MTPSIDELRTELYSAVVSDALDAAGYRKQWANVPLPPVTSNRVLLGRCKTTLWEDIDFKDPEPYALELKAVDECEKGDVLIAAAHGSERSGIWGELLSTASMNSGCIGAIIDGAVRDVGKMREMDFAVYARGVCPYDSLHRQRVIEVDGEVNVGGVTVRSGDWVIADEDGVVFIPGEISEQIFAAAWEKVHAENEVRDAIRGGMSATDVFEKYGIL